MPERPPEDEDVLALIEQIRVVPDLAFRDHGLEDQFLQLLAEVTELAKPKRPLGVNAWRKSRSR